MWEKSALGQLWAHQRKSTRSRNPHHLRREVDPAPDGTELTLHRAHHLQMISTTLGTVPLRRALANAPRPRLASPAPRAFAPVFAQHRSFSLWPTSTPAAPAPEAAPVKPSLMDLSAPTSLPDPTLFEPLSAAFLSLPPSLSLSYAAFIPLFTLFYRSTTTLPIVMWQRRRTRRFADLVMPLLRREQGRLALETRDECRRAGKTFEEYQAVFKKKVRPLARYTLVPTGPRGLPDSSSRPLAGQEGGVRPRAAISVLASPHPHPAARHPHPHLHLRDARPARRLRARHLGARRHAVVALELARRVAGSEPDFGGA